MYSVLKPLLFQLQAETAHHLSLAGFQQASQLPLLSNAVRAYLGTARQNPTDLFGLSFKNPIGLAAGFDKNAEYLHAFQQLGFGFIEIGTLTPKPQVGNPKPRLFRIPQDQAIINRMGFNNKGVIDAKKRLENRPDNIIVGGNIGKNKVTPNNEAVNDYLICFKELHELVDYFVVNVSSPNTPGLRELQEKEPLKRILSAVQEQNKGNKVERPVLLKIAPDLTEGQLSDIADLAIECELSGLVATNTTIDRKSLSISQKQIKKIGNGGLSGKPVKEKSLAILKQLRTVLPKDFPIIGVGGIGNPEDALERLQAGADLIQIYSGLIYYGPHLVRDICKELSQNLKA